MARTNTAGGGESSHSPSQRPQGYDSVGEAQVALRNSGLSYPALDNRDDTDMAEWMHRHNASPEEAAIAFGVTLPGDLTWRG